jgi:hypothetical protein
VTISTLDAVATIAGRVLPVEDLTVTLDESRAPFAAATLTVPYDPATIDALDPRARPVPRVSLTLSQRFVAARTLAAISATYAGRTLAAISATYGAVSAGVRTNTAVTPVASSVGAPWTYSLGTGETFTTVAVTTAGDGPQGRTGYIRRTVLTPKSPTIPSGPIYKDVAAAGTSGGAGDVWSVGMWVRVSVPVTITPQGHVVRGATQVSSKSGTPVAVAAGTWTWLAVDGVPSVATYDSVRMFCQLPGSAVLPVGATIDTTDALIIKAPTAGDYFDGSYTDAPPTAYAWSGVPNGSTSTATTTAMPNRTLAAVSGDYGTGYNPFGIRSSRTRTYDLGVRSRVVDHRAATVQVALASDEALLSDGALVAAAAVSPPALTVLSAVQLALGLLLPGYTLTTTQGAQAITVDAAVWDPGTSGWDYLAPLTSSAGLRLWCDEARTWHLEAPAAIPVPDAMVVLAGTGSVTDAQDSISRDDLEWFNAVVVAYDWTDTGNVRHVQYDVAGDLASSRVLTVKHDRPYPRAGEAATRLRLATGHGRVLDVEAVADPVTYPGVAARLSVPGTPAQSGYVQAVEVRTGDARMRVTTRDLIDTPATAWAFGNLGQSWADVPAGMSWASFDWSGVAA